MELLEWVADGKWRADGGHGWGWGGDRRCRQVLQTLRSWIWQESRLQVGKQGTIERAGQVRWGLMSVRQRSCTLSRRQKERTRALRLGGAG